MLSVEMTVIPAAKQILDVLIALEMTRAWRIGMRQLVHQRDLWMARKNRLGVHLLQRHAAIRRSARAG